MKKRILTGAIALLLIIPAILQAAAVNKAEDIAPGNSMVTADFSLTGKLQAFLKPFIEKELEEELKYSSGDEDAAKIKLVVDSFLEGKRFFVGFAAPESILIAFPVTEDGWATLTAGDEEHTYGATKVYQDKDAFVAKLGELAVLSPTQDGIHAAIDLAEGTATNSLTNNTEYQQFTADYITPRLFGLTIDIQALSEFIGPLLGMGSSNGNMEKDTAEEEEATPNPINAFLEILELFDFEGMSFGEIATGYKFNIKIAGNEENLKKEDISLSPGGSFTPSLYKKFPGAKPILYSESFNPKANFADSKKFLKKLQKSLGVEEEIDIFAEVKEETGLDVEEMYNVFDQEIAFGFQYNQNSPLPYITLMGNASNNKAAATKLIDDLTKFVTDALKEAGAPKKAYKVTTEGGFTKITFDITAIEENYDGPPFPKVVLTFGVSDDGLFIISNYPDIDDESKRTGFAADPDFSSHMNAETGANTGIFYLNARNVWGWSDAMTTWGERIGGGEHGPPLDFYQGYYSVLEKIYGFRDLFVVSKGTDFQSSVTGTVTIDQAKHKTYEQLLEELKTSDRDGDGTSDYDERYVYHTSVETGDSDNDGVSDVEELQKGFDPEGEGRLWEDVGEDDYYTDETAFLYQRGAIKGYSDGTFQPGKNVNRAEFTTMVVKAFEQGTSNFLGVDVELAAKAPPFADINAVDWYYNPVAKAYAAGFISGSTDPITGELNFRPGNNITRAEAIAILNKASQALTKTKPQASCSDSPFKDVGQNDWFCDEVANAYANGVTKGKAADAFRPFDELTRGEAAVMIKRTLEIDIEIVSSGTESFGELAQPLLPGPGISSGLIPLFR